MIRNFGGVTGLTNQPQGLDVGLSGSNIKSIQRGTFTMPATAGFPLVSNIPISSVDLTKSIVMVSFNNNSASANSAYAPVMAELTSATNLKFTGYTNGTAVSPFEWQVIEFNNVKSVQHGVGANNSSSNETITISTVDPSKSMIIGSFYSSGTASWAISFKIVNATSIGINRYTGTTGSTAAWQVIEFF